MIELILAIVIAIIPACPTEDSTGCYWDGGDNGQGHSYIAIR